MTRIAAMLERDAIQFIHRRFTVSDLAAMPTDLPSGSVRYELDNGRLISMPPHVDLHGAVELTIGAEFKFQGQRVGHGKARCGEVGVVLWRDPDRVVGADVVFIANASLPIRRSPEGYLETIPDLVVEVVSKNDTRPFVARKVEDYIQAGVRVVWMADSGDETVTVHIAGAAPRVLRGEDTLTVEELIPGFRLCVADAFVV